MHRLTDEAIAAYIQQFFTKRVLTPSSSASKPDSKAINDDKSSELIAHNVDAFALHAFLKRKSILLDISGGYLDIDRSLNNLELICSIWAEQPLDAELTMTELYHKLLQKILQSHCQRTQIDEKNYLASLEQKAFEELPIPFEKDDMRYALSYQKFFAASYLVGLLSQPSSQEKAKQFIRQHKYDPNYELVLVFTAGLLRLNKHTAAIPVFWKAIEEPPRDLTGIAHLRLITNCLEEGMGEELSPAEKAQLVCVKTAYEATRMTQLGEEQKEPQSVNNMFTHLFKERHLIPLLKQNRRVLQQIGAVSALEQQLLAAKDEKNKGNLIAVLSVLNPATAPITATMVNELCTIALDNNSPIGLRIKAINVLGELTSAAGVPANMFDKLCEMAIVKDAHNFFKAAANALSNWVILAPKLLQQKIIILFPTIAALDGWDSDYEFIISWISAPRMVEVPNQVVDIYCDIVKKEIEQNGKCSTSNHNAIAFLYRSKVRATSNVQLIFQCINPTHKREQTLNSVASEQKHESPSVSTAVKKAPIQIISEPDIDIYALCQTAQDEKADNKDRTAAIKSLGSLHSSEVTQQVITTLIRIVKTKNESGAISTWGELAFKALGQLASAGNEAAVSTLCELAQDNTVASMRDEAIEQLKNITRRSDVPVLVTITMVFCSIVRKPLEAPRPRLQSAMFRGEVIDAVGKLAESKKLPMPILDIIVDDLYRIAIEENESNMNNAINAFAFVTKRSSPHKTTKIATWLSNTRFDKTRRQKALDVLSELPLRSVIQHCLETLGTKGVIAISVLALIQGRAIILTDQGFQFYTQNNGIVLLGWQGCIRVDIDHAAVIDQITKALVAPALQCQLPVPEVQPSWPLWQLLHLTFSQAHPFPKEILCLIIAYTHLPEQPVNIQTTAVTQTAIGTQATVGATTAAATQTTVEVQATAVTQAITGAQITKTLTPEQMMNLALLAFPRLVIQCGEPHTKSTKVAAANGGIAAIGAATVASTNPAIHHHFNSSGP